MRKIWIPCAIVLLGCSVLSYFLLAKFNCKKQTQLSYLNIKGSYFHPVEITDFISQIPCVDIQIGDKTTTTKIDLGFCGYISLPEKLLQDLDDKLFVRRISYFGMRGKKYDSNVYELPQIKIGKVNLIQAKAEEINPEFEKDATIFNPEESPSIDHLGRIGWALFHNLNFFLDCENSLMAFCDSLDTLKKQGYPTDSFVEVPLLLDRNLIEFEVTTEAGPLRCMLDTGSTKNILIKNMNAELDNHMIFSEKNIGQHSCLNPTNADQMVFNPEDVCSMSVFKIGTVDFGTVTFQKMKIPFEIDAIIGMEFLDSKLIFIDFPNRKLYFHEKQPLNNSPNDL